MRFLVAVALLGFGLALSADQNGDKAHSQVCPIKVSGMFCGECAKTVEKAAKKIDGVKSAKVSQPKGLAEITYDPTKTNPDAIAKALSAKTPFKAEAQERSKQD